MRARVLALLLGAVAVSSACQRSGGQPQVESSKAPSSPVEAPSTTRTTADARSPVHVAAAGDIACAPGEAVTPTRCRMGPTSELLVGQRLDAVLTLGDNQYPTSTLERMQRSYDATWGRVKAITRPSAGNHDYAGGASRGYFAYFGGAAGESGKGWYSFDLGGWHLVSLNSNCGAVGGCGPGSPQYEWLVADLAAHPARCTLAYWHHPRFSSGFHGDNLAVAPFWRALYAAGAEMVLNGHDHHYERFSPLSPEARIDPERGIRQFIVGTGGHSLYPAPFPMPGSESRNNTTFGVLRLTLWADRYEAEFVPEAGKTFTDRVEGRCHQ